MKNAMRLTNYNKISLYKLNNTIITQNFKGNIKLVLSFIIKDFGNIENF